ncbi:MAG: hypothetical protein A3H98_00675 [Bacteroidetes bacterium RIFCSPLOWO2_02_FULL_36_8]|nr:MAG: hypothetical protein A3H98_00675 [Bacteroidetes bacterium RIFCSPLOWO2_02_FULL_36_8]OFY68735.1 MAG: hypothetical protein A3G23_02775 [Bacteroidetes bacterium RIFCSPLOWO2_12_FULL_37_12]
MKKLLLPLILAPYMVALSQTIKIAQLKYSGGGDWYANPTSVPNLIAFCNQNLNTNLHPERVIVEASSPEIFNFPFIHVTGHGNIVFTPSDVENLRKYLKGGGFLHIDDNYGMDQFIRNELKKLFPQQELVEVPFYHPVYHQKYDFPNGLPKVHEHDGKPPQGFGIFYEGRLVCFYSYESDLSDGWEDPHVHNDPEEKRQQALKMGANLISYAFSGR